MSEKKTKGPRPLKAGWYQISVVRCRDQKMGEGRFEMTEEAVSVVLTKKAMITELLEAAIGLRNGWDQAGAEKMERTQEAKRKARAEKLLAELEELGYEQAGVVKSPTVGIAGPQIPGAGQEGEPPAEMPEEEDTP